MTIDLVFLPTRSPLAVQAVHYVYEDEPDLALCGVNVAGEAWNYDDSAPICVVCDAMAEDDA